MKLSETMPRPCWTCQCNEKPPGTSQWGSLETWISTTPWTCLVTRMTSLPYLLLLWSLGITSALLVANLVGFFVWFSLKKLHTIKFTLFGVLWILTNDKSHVTMPTTKHSSFESPILLSVDHPHNCPFSLLTSASLPSHELLVSCNLLLKHEVSPRLYLPSFSPLILYVFPWGHPPRPGSSHYPTNSLLSRCLQRLCGSSPPSGLCIGLFWVVTFPESLSKAASALPASQHFMFGFHSSSHAP